tara:strand:+ start:1617 stop:1880 length:264 start_codon:yes stop_codon:yes gene_type:complete
MNENVSYPRDMRGDGEHKPHLVVPCILEANDTRFSSPQGFNSGEQFFQYLKDSFDVLYEEGADAPKMMFATGNKNTPFGRTDTGVKE